MSAMSSASLRSLILKTTHPKTVLSTTLRLITPASSIYKSTEEETGFKGGPFWGFVWPGSYGLARWIGEKPEVVRGKRVLDFAAGCGLSGFAALSAGASHVVFNDIDTAAVSAVTINAAVNGLGEDDPSWSTVSENLIGTSVDADVIIAGDVCYEADLARDVVEWLTTGEREGGEP